MSDPTKAPISLHASCVIWRGHGILITGVSGAGKSQAAILLIHAGAQFVADDIVLVDRCGTGLRASPPQTGAGLIELRGQGVFRLPSMSTARIGLLIEATAAMRMQRLPQPSFAEILKVRLPRICLDPLMPGFVERLTLAMGHERVA